MLQISEVVIWKINVFGCGRNTVVIGSKSHDAHSPNIGVCQKRYTAAGFQQIQATLCSLAVMNKSMRLQIP